MAASLPSVSLTAGIWIDLYAATGIEVGVPLQIQDIGLTKVRVTESVLEPASLVGHNVMYPRDFLNTVVTPVGVWAWSRTPGSLQVEEL
jgi:hypothetical protein